MPTKGAPFVPTVSVGEQPADIYPVGGAVPSDTDEASSALSKKQSVYRRLSRTSVNYGESSHNPIAAFRRADRSADTRNAETQWQGDADSLFITGIASKGKAGADGKNKDIKTEYLIRWYTTGHHILGDTDDVYAAAFVRRPAKAVINAVGEVDDNTPEDGINQARPALDIVDVVEETISPVVLSSNPISVDGDRPVQGTMYFVQEESDGDYSDVPLGYAGKGYAREGKGRALKKVEDFGAITGGPSGDNRSDMGIDTDNERIVLGIGDSLSVYIKLDDVEYSTIRSESELNVILDVGIREEGKFKKQKASPSSRTDYHKATTFASARTVLEHVDEIEEGDYGDLGDQTTVLQAYLQDGAGNVGAKSFFIRADSPLSCQRPMRLRQR